MLFPELFFFLFPVNQVWVKQVNNYLKSSAYAKVLTVWVKQVYGLREEELSEQLSTYSDK